MKNAEYTTESITVLSPVEHIRRRPGMYLGDLNSPMTITKYLQEAMEPALTHHINKTCNYIKLTVLKDCVAIEYEKGTPLVSSDAALDRMMTKINYYQINEYLLDEKLCSTGPVLANALSSKLTVESSYCGKFGSIQYCAGELDRNLRIEPIIGEEFTRIVCWPDQNIFKKLYFDRGVFNEWKGTMKKHFPKLRLDIQIFN